MAELEHDKEFLLSFRRALIMVVREIDKRYAPAKSVQDTDR